jgi:hypothetical protein
MFYPLIEHPEAWALGQRRNEAFGSGLAVFGLGDRSVGGFCYVGNVSVFRDVTAGTPITASLYVFYVYYVIVREYLATNALGDRLQPTQDRHVVEVGRAVRSVRAKIGKCQHSADRSRGLFRLRHAIATVSENHQQRGWVAFAHLTRHRRQVATE